MNKKNDERNGRKPGLWTVWLLHLGSITLFAFALAGLIPPVPSDPVTKYHFLPGGLIMTAAFTGSLLLRPKIQRDPIWKIVVLTAIYVGIGILTFQRSHIK